MSAVAIEGKLLERWQTEICTILEYFIQLCDKHHLTYYCCGGTALGAVRHNGFIPWDDDIDVMMPRADYEKLLSLAEKDGAIAEEYEFTTPEKTENYYLTYAKLCKKNSSLWEVLNYPCMIGLFIDIFPVDGCSGDDKTFKKDFLAFDECKKNLIGVSAVYPLTFYVKKMLKLKWRTVVKLLLYHHNRDKYRGKILTRMHRLITRYNATETNYVCNYTGYGGAKERLEKKWLGEGTYMKFEHLTVKIPKQYDAYLQHLYGDYMTMPPVEKRKSHHHLCFLDLDRRFTIEEILEQKQAGRAKKIEM